MDCSILAKKAGFFSGQQYTPKFCYTDSMWEMLNFNSMMQLITSINLLDAIIVFVVCFYAYEGYTLGFALATVDLLSFIISFIAALKLYPFAADFLITFFSVPIGFANAIGFLFLAFVIEVILGILFRKLLQRIPKIKKTNKAVELFRNADHWLGLIPGLITAVIILGFLLSVILSLPTSPPIKSLVTHSKIGAMLIANTSVLESKVNEVFGGAISETLNFITVKPEGDEMLKLNYTMTEGTVDEQAEREMLTLVNQERVKAGLKEVIFDDGLRDVGRAHSKDMFERGYFSHFTPEGKSPFDRMDEAGIAYSFAGENLALAPSTQLAMQGLMNSKGHRANILNPNFKKLGIGVIDGGAYGKMYSQEFSD